MKPYLRIERRVSAGDVVCAHCRYPVHDRSPEYVPVVDGRDLGDVRGHEPLVYCTSRCAGIARVEPLEVMYL